MDRTNSVIGTLTAAALVATVSGAEAQPSSSGLATCSFNDNVLNVEVTDGTFQQTTLHIDLAGADTRQVDLNNATVHMGDQPEYFGAAGPLENTLINGGYAISLVDQSLNSGSAPGLSHEFFLRAPDWSMLGVGIYDPENIEKIHLTDHKAGVSETIQCDGFGQLVLASN